MDTKLVSGLENFCYRYLNKSGLLGVLNSENKEETEFYHINTQKIIKYMHKNKDSLTEVLKLYLINLEFISQELEYIINKRRAIPISQQEN